MADVYVALITMCITVVITSLETVVQVLDIGIFIVSILKKATLAFLVCKVGEVNDVTLIRVGRNVRIVGKDFLTVAVFRNIAVTGCISLLILGTFERGLT